MQEDPTVMPGQQRDNKPVGDISRDHISYGRDQLMAINPSRLTKDLTTRLRSLEIGTGLPRKRYHRKAKSKIVIIWIGCVSTYNLAVW